MYELQLPGSASAVVVDQRGAKPLTLHYVVGVRDAIQCLADQFRLTVVDHPAETLINFEDARAYFRTHDTGGSLREDRAKARLAGNDRLGGTPMPRLGGE